MEIDAALFAEVRDHDLRLQEEGIVIWIGSEPTFTNPRSQEPYWISEALGGEKESHAKALLVALAPQLAGPVDLLQVRGRQYPGETKPRFCYGALFQRYGELSGPLAESELGSRGRRASSAQMDLTSDTPAPSPDQAWLTVTPDPAVVEVNMAPAHDLTTFASWAETVYGAARAAGLSPMRFRYNGEATDSGGGGQITLGGPTPKRSPFFVYPQLLPGLVRYTNRHPALSYYFASTCCGSASQSPRADEGVRERFDELPVALDYLAARGDKATPRELWSMLSPLLVDASGCAHRAELNIEKLWNPWFEGRGQLGLVELRALRMPATPTRLVAIAALFRAVAARLAKFPFHEPLIDWGADLHDSASLPWHLKRDLQAVLADLEAHGFGLGPLLCEALMEEPEPTVVLEQDVAELEVRSAISFWPLLGDAALQATHGARIVDSSIARVQLLVKVPHGRPFGQLGANGHAIPLQPVTHCPVDPHPSFDYALGSVVYRSFVPQYGLHPEIPAHDPWTLEWVRGDNCTQITLHAWHPGGGYYDGLPRGAAEAHARRAARVLISSSDTRRFKHGAATGSKLDLRCVRADS